MANTYDEPFARIRDIILGVYPAAPVGDDRQIPVGTFTQGSFRLPLENKKFPHIDVERKFDLRWPEQEFAGDSPDVENQSQGPHLVAQAIDLRISYAFRQAGKLAPPEALLDMGAFEAAERKANNDWRVLEWALCWRGNWTGTTPKIVAIRRRARVTTKEVDGVRVVLFAPLVLEVSVPVSSGSPGLGT